MGRQETCDMKKARRLVVSGLVAGMLAISTVGCMGHGQASERQHGSSVITAEEMQALSVSSVTEAVQRLRPNWLAARGALSIQNPAAGRPIVFVDGIRFGTAESLQRVRVIEVEFVRYLNARDATTRYGTGHAGGVIAVTTKR
jgi:outer membrane receptor for ferrienterochelin and colicin